MPSWCFNFSKKDWKKSDLSTCLGATQSASMSAPANQSIFYQEEYIKYYIFFKVHINICTQESIQWVQENVIND